MPAAGYLHDRHPAQSAASPVMAAVTRCTRRQRPAQGRPRAKLNPHPADISAIMGGAMPTQPRRSLAGGLPRVMR